MIEEGNHTTYRIDYNGKYLLEHLKIINNKQNIIIIIS